MSDWLNDLGLSGLLTSERIAAVLRAGITLVVGILLARLVSRALGKVAAARTTPQGALLVRRLSYYVLFVLVLASALDQLHFKLGVLLGAAGIISVALGFASQTSASNLISGLFLIAERPFVVGDIVSTGEVTGEVLSVDLLSVKLRTFDNLFVRVPNEEIIKSRITNLTHFPIRRLDIQVGVAYKEDLEKVKEVLFEIADRNPICLDEPKPLLIFKGFGDSSIDYQFSVWAARENFLELRNSMQERIKAAFDERGIEIPFPHRTLYTGSVTEPFPVRVVEQTDRQAAHEEKT
jgi:small-conductance mechanosensitive channel